MVKVTDADREAAEICRKMTAEWQRHFLAEAFARHRIAGAKAALEKAAEKCADYMFDCIEDHDVFKNWPRTKRQNDIYAKLIRNIDPEECE